MNLSAVMTAQDLGDIICNDMLSLPADQMLQVCAMDLNVVQQQIMDMVDVDAIAAAVS